MIWNLWSDLVIFFTRVGLIQIQPIFYREKNEEICMVIRVADPDPGILVEFKFTLFDVRIRFSEQDVLA